MTLKTVAFIGVGNIGAPMARNARRGGFDLVVCNRNEALEGIRGHSKKFWNPRMRCQLLEQVEAAPGEGTSDLLPIVAEALRTHRSLV